MSLSNLIQKAGGVAEVARMCGITSQAVSQWTRIPVERCAAIEAGTYGAVTRQEMRPDIWPEPARPKAKAA